MTCSAIENYSSSSSNVPYNIYPIQKEIEKLSTAYDRTLVRLTPHEKQIRDRIEKELTRDKVLIKNNLQNAIFRENKFMDA